MTSEMASEMASKIKASKAKFRPDYTHSHGSRVCDNAKCKDRIRTADSVSDAVGKVIWLSEAPMTAQEITDAVRKVLPQADLEQVQQALDNPDKGRAGPAPAVPQDGIAMWEHKWANDYASLEIDSTMYSASALVALLKECNARILIPRRRTFRYVELASSGSVEHTELDNESGRMIEHACIGCDYGIGREKYGFWPPPPDPRDEGEPDEDYSDHDEATANDPTVATAAAAVTAAAAAVATAAAAVTAAAAAAVTAVAAIAVDAAVTDTATSTETADAAETITAATAI
jgi:hypothetical protein